jgi:hypothetical protein
VTQWSFVLRFVIYHQKISFVVTLAKVGDLIAQFGEELFGGKEEVFIASNYYTIPTIYH